MRWIETEIRIAAAPQRVWELLTDFRSYRDWNPFVREIDGRPEAGAQLDVTIAPPGVRPMRFRPRLMAVEPRQRLAWLGRVLVRGLFDGEHSFELQPLPDGGTRFRHSERFYGLLVPFLWERLERPTRAGFEAMNAALKRRAESP